MLEVITNNQPRELLALADLPHFVQVEFDYVDSELKFEPRFVRYKGEYYDLFDMLQASDSIPGRWQVQQSYTYYSGFVARVCEDGESAVCGRFFCK